MNSLNRFADPVYCIMRLVIGLTYACHGSQKLLAIPGGGHGATGIALIAGFVELFAGLGIAFGFLFHYFLRPGTLEHRRPVVQRQKQCPVHLIQT